jgi:hypothetical protein
MPRALTKLLGTVAGLLFAAPFVGAAAATAAPTPITVYVSPSGAAGQADTSCQTAAFTAINDAIAAVPNGSTVRICAGTYFEDAVVTKPITLEGFGKTSKIDATGQQVIPGAGGNGVTVLAARATIESLAVVNASGDGILVAGANNTSVIATWTRNNGGFGVDLNSTMNSRAAGNTAKDNVAGGINLANDLGVPAAHNVITGNTLIGNTNGCGIVLADHTGAGIFSNTVSNNVANDNGLTVEGAGIVLASPVPGGGVFNNMITGNQANGNGLSGITLHGHLEGQNFSGNVLKGNVLGTNNLLGDDPGVQTGDVADTQTTGILIATSDPLAISIQGNVIHDDHFGIWTLGGITITGSNTFSNVVVPVFDASA